MFHNARIKLTSWYLLIIMCISVSFSAVIYRVLTFEMDRFAQRQQVRIERQLENRELFPEPPKPVSGTIQQFLAFDPDIINETKHRLQIQLIAINIAIVGIAGALGYVLAGKTLKPIADMLDEQRRFVSDASHELRTPLTALKSSMEVALRDQQFTTEEARTIMKDNIQDVNTLQKLTDQLLELARIEMNGHKKHYQVVNIRTVIDQAVKRIAPIAARQAINIESQSVSIAVLGDSTALVDCCIVLLDNAIKYSPKHTTVHISAITRGNDVNIAVRDHGIGINETDIPHIFDRFYRADSARSKTKTTGYGLGLSIAKKIIEEHSGTISVTSSIRKGSTFIITLPIVKPRREA